MWFCPSYLLAGASLLLLDVRYLFLVGSNILLKIVVQQVSVLEFLQEKMSACPSTPPSCIGLYLYNFWFCFYRWGLHDLFFLGSVLFAERSRLKLKAYIHTYQGFPGSSESKESSCNAGDPGSIPGSGRSSREGNGYPLQYSWTFLVVHTAKNPPAF